jgi:hypothetical protein
MGEKTPRCFIYSSKVSKKNFLVEFNPLGNETYQKVQMVLFMDLLKPFVVYVNGVEISSPFHLRH